jgi:hypothetical protein
MRNPAWRCSRCPRLVLAVAENEFVLVQHRRVLHAADRHEQAFSGARPQRVRKPVNGGRKEGRQPRNVLFAIRMLFHGL